MVEEFIVQAIDTSLVEAEERVYQFCQRQNVGNYNATVTTATLQVVKEILSSANSVVVEVELGQCKGGIYVRIEHAATAISTWTIPPIVPLLADGVELSDNGKGVTLVFTINGIDPSDALQRRVMLHQYQDTVSTRQVHHA